ncbi:hypothetical protein CYMTET_56694, partial [Cymbomonas tetramitiformis]
FRDRRYEYKGLNKKWKGKLGDAQKSGNPIHIQEAGDMCVLYDSLQLAHKCILNSFYGYVMRKGARWYSMEMAGAVTYTGAKIIQLATDLVMQIGKPLELDTDGIWCCLPATFPENFEIKTSEPGKKTYTINYPCVVLNMMVVDTNTNTQFQELVDPVNRTYKMSDECSIEFEVDGPYKAMILPASKDEGVLIKKRYAVFNFDGSLAELKGFEVKRRGELKLIKVFQSEVFGHFLDGSTLEDCYGAVAAIANRWLDMLDTEGVDLVDDELLEYISESNTMSKSLEDYGDRKSCATTCALRLSHFLGADSIKDKGLNCRYIVARKPEGAPTSQRAIPVAIFRTEPSVARHHLRQWTKESPPGDSSTPPDVRDLVDWEYYKTRLGSAIQKIISIPAAMQKVKNPVPRVVHPDWLWKKIRDRDDTRKQLDIGAMMRKATDRAAEASAMGDAMEVEAEAEAGPAAAPAGTPAVEMDMEDFGVSGRGSGPRQKAERIGRATRLVTETLQGAMPSGGEEGANSEEAAPSSTPDAAADEADAAMPDRAEDYKGWLEHMKQKWRADRQARKRQRAEEEGQELGGEGAERAAIGPAGGVGNAMRSGQSLGNFYRRQQAAVTEAYWQVVQFAETSTLGTFTAWILVEGRMYSVPIHVPRRFYINLRTPDLEADMGLGLRKRVHFQPPHSRPALNLYEVQLAEEDMVSGSQEMALQMASTDVEGVYESRCPLLLQLLVDVGCCLKVAKHAQKRPLSEGFSVAELEMKTTTECPYLEIHPQHNLRHIMLYYSEADTRGVYALLLLPLGQCLVLVVSPFASREVTPQSAQRVYRDAGGPAPEGDIELKFEVEYVASHRDAQKRVHRALELYRDQFRGATVAMTEGPISGVALGNLIPALQQMPCVAVPHNAYDSQYPTLGWQSVAARAGMQRCASSMSWLQQRLSLARYAHVPLGNFGTDWLLFTSDIFFARALRDSRQLLWATDLGEPDFGGASLGSENLAPMGQLEREAAAAIRGESNPGAYRRVCVEFKVHHLAVNSLYVATQLAELDGAMAVDIPGVQPEGPAAAMPAFKVLKSLVQSWLGDAMEHANIYADHILKQVYRWLSSPQSLLQDAMLRTLVSNCMSKLFKVLLAEMVKLGCTIVYADFSQITICTGKRSMPAALSYVECLLEALRGRELFPWIELEPCRHWHSLLFKDLYNMGGVVQPTAEDDLAQRELEGEAADEDQEQEQEQPPAGSPRILSNWNMADYLPPAIQDYFVLIVSEFIYLPWKQQQEQEEANATAAAVAAALNEEGMPSGTPSVTALKAAERDAAEANYLQDQISQHFTQKLLKVVRDMQRHLGGNADPNDTAHAFPSLAGSHLTAADLGSPATAFVRSVLAVMELDKHAEDGIVLLRRNLFRMLHVGEFSPGAQFRDPCLSFTLQDVICTYCNDCRDLDLCRDPDIQQKKWRCRVASCQHPYDLETIESRLMQIVRKRVHAYQLQDLKCAKCRQVKAGHVATQCVCGGSFKCTQTAEDLEQGLRVFQHVAQWHDFEWLGETMSWLLKS